MSSFLGFTRMLIALLDSIPEQGVSIDEREGLFQLLQAASMYLDAEQRTTLSMRLVADAIRELNIREATEGEAFAALALMKELSHLWEPPATLEADTLSPSIAEIVEFHTN